MREISSLEDLQELRKQIISEEVEAKPTIIVCGCTSCQASGSNRLIRRAKQYILSQDLVEKIQLRVSGCPGFSETAPFILTEPQGAFYTKLHHYHVPRIIDAVLADKYVEELLYQKPGTGKRYYHYDEIPFFEKQQRILLAKNQEVDPIRLFDYLSKGGYLALEKVIAKSEPSWIIEEIKRSGLRGRGGAGFPTWKKWELMQQQDSSEGKYVVCNADEGDPGAYMDRSILEGNPHSVIEGMIIGGIAMGASEGFIFVRHEYPLATKHTIIALRLARECGLLGKNILGTGIDYDINIVKSAGAFVCGEETALIKTIEGFIGEPTQRPPYPIEKGILGKPTCINNVETWANVPVIIENGADKYASIGTPQSTGTKVFSLVGKIRNTGLVEVPMGMPIKEIVYDIGGGPQEGNKIKAIQIGGPSGGCIPHSHFDLPIDYDSLTDAGAIMGSGGMIVMDQNTCMVDVAKYFMSFLKDESCGKCFTCRKGTQRMFEILDDITKGEGSFEKLDLLRELAQVVQDTTMCGLGQSAPNPVLSTLRYFREEYDRHIVDKRCDAYVCKDLVGAPCQTACPIGTQAWQYVAHISRGEYEEAYQVIRETNPFPSVCARVCDHKCEARCRLGTTGKQPVAIRDLKRFVTDRFDPGDYKPDRRPTHGTEAVRVAVVGSGPAGLTAAHNLSLMNYKVTVFEADDRPGGMLISGVPAYRLPRDVLKKEIDAILDENITLKCNTALGRDFKLDKLFADNFKAVFVALGAHQSRKMKIEGEDSDGVYPSMQFLKAWNLKGENLAQGRVGVIGGGNSAIDAARVALRQKGVKEVTILYRRTRREMPAFELEIDAALEEGVKLETLVSPVKIHLEDNRLQAVELIKNDLGEVDSSGRQRPVPRADSEYSLPVDTLIVAIGEQPQSFDLDGSAGLEVHPSGRIVVDPETLATKRADVFAGGDAVTGPNTVVDAIAAGRKAAVMIDRYLRVKELKQPAAAKLPTIYVEQPPVSQEEIDKLRRAEPPTSSPEERRQSFVEVEQTLSEGDAVKEAKRCLRCDLEYTKPKEESDFQKASGGQS